MTELRPRLPEGIPEIGLQPLDPFHLEKLDFKTGRGNVVIKAHFTNITMKYLTSFTKAIFRINTKQRVLNFEFEAPRVRIDGIYNLGGNILFIPVGGSGPYWFDVGKY